MADRQALVRDFPAVLKYQRDLAATEHNLGALYNVTNRLELAETAWTNALHIRRALANAHPSVADFQTNLALSLMNLGMLYATTGRPDLSEASYKEASTILRTMTRERPTATEYRMFSGVIPAWARRTVPRDRSSGTGRNRHPRRARDHRPDSPGPPCGERLRPPPGDVLRQSRPNPRRDPAGRSRGLAHAGHNPPRGH